MNIDFQGHYGCHAHPERSGGWACPRKRGHGTLYSVRRGLAPLEFILALPILLFLMALMINFGTVSAWKVRALTVARHQLWGNSSDHTLSNTPRPEYWPTSADMRDQGLNDITSLDTNHSTVNQRVARGQPLSPGHNSTVYAGVLNPARGPREGTSDLSRAYPLLGKYQSYKLHGAAMFLDDKWQYWRMQWGDGNQRVGLASNSSRRMPVIYSLEQAPADLQGAFVQAANDILALRQKRTSDGTLDPLKPLDHDNEDYYFRAEFGWGGLLPRDRGDFYPRLRGFCSTDMDLVQTRVDDLVARIQGVPSEMTQEFLRMYNWVLDYPNQMANWNPPASPAEIARVRAEIQALNLQPKIDALNQFQQSLQ